MRSYKKVAGVCRRDTTLHDLGMERDVPTHPRQVAMLRKGSERRRRAVFRWRRRRGGGRRGVRTSRLSVGRLSAGCSAAIGRRAVACATTLTPAAVATISATSIFVAASHHIMRARTGRVCLQRLLEAAAIDRGRAISCNACGTSSRISRGRRFRRDGNHSIARQLPVLSK